MHSEHFHESPDSHPWSLIGVFVGAAGHTLKHVHKSGLLGERSKDATPTDDSAIGKIAKSISSAASSASKEEKKPMVLPMKAVAARKRRSSEISDSNAIKAKEAGAVHQHDGMPVCLSDVHEEILPLPTDFSGDSLLGNRQMAAGDKPLHETVAEFIVFPADAHVAAAADKREELELGEELARRKRETGNDEEPKTVVLNYELIVEHTNDKFNHDSVADEERNPLNQIAHKLLQSGCPCAQEKASKTAAEDKQQETPTT